MDVQESLKTKEQMFMMIQSKPNVLNAVQKNYLVTMKEQK